MTTPRRSTLHRLAACGAAVAVAVGLAACSTGDDATGETSGTATVSPDPDATQKTPAPQADGVSVTDAWVKAADTGMTGMFATVANDGAEAVHIVGAASELSPVEIHEMAMDDSGAMVMRAKEGGVEIPAGESVTFAPGGDHFMLMELSAPVQAGGEYVVTLDLSDGSTVDVSVEGRTYSGAQEDYEG